MAKKNKNDQIPTPVEYIRNMLDQIGYTQNVVGKKILENSCGRGSILRVIVERYLIDAAAQGLSIEETREGLERDIIGFELDPVECEICKNQLNVLCAAHGVFDIQWNIYTEDFLKHTFEKQDIAYVVGNPPYITHHDLSEEERVYLKENFEVCKKGRFDYCYAFFVFCFLALAPNGVMIYLIPFSIFRNRYAKELRKYIYEGMTGITDYSGIDVFSGITCSVALLQYEKAKKSEYFWYKNVNEERLVKYSKDILPKDGEKWIFSDICMRRNRFGDYFDVLNGIATLYNRAFLVQEEEQLEVEPESCLPAVSTKSCKKEEVDTWIIFPYKRENNEITRYMELELKERYPKTYAHLLKYKDALKQRKKDSRARWFEYGRSQALNSLWEEKLVLPMVITESAKTYYAEQDAVPYAGYFVTKKPEVSYSLEFAAELLESSEFYQYVKAVGTPTTRTSYRISVNDIKNYRFD